MRDSKDRHESEELPARTPLPDGEKFFDPWEEEFRKSYNNDDKAFELGPLRAEMKPQKGADLLVHKAHLRKASCRHRFSSYESSVVFVGEYSADSGARIKANNDGGSSLRDLAEGLGRSDALPLDNTLQERISVHVNHYCSMIGCGNGEGLGFHPPKLSKHAGGARNIIRTEGSKEGRPI